MFSVYPGLFVWTIGWSPWKKRFLPSFPALAWLAIENTGKTTSLTFCFFQLPAHSSGRVQKNETNLLTTNNSKEMRNVKQRVILSSCKQVQWTDLLIAFKTRFCHPALCWAALISTSSSSLRFPLFSVLVVRSHWLQQIHDTGNWEWHPGLSPSYVPFHLAF